MASQDKFDCNRIANDLDTLLSSLEKIEVLDGRPPASFTWVRKCAVCGRKRGGGCEGAEVRIEQMSPLAFVSCRTREGYRVRADISGLSKRFGHGRHQVAEHSVLVRVWEMPTPDNVDESGAAIQRVVHRVRVEMAKGNATEPFAHLQLGGRLAGEDEHWSLPESSGYPRWPTPLVDFILASELVLYTFFPSQWRAFRDKAENLAILHRSEQLYVSLLFDTWNEYISKRQIDSQFKRETPTFLSAVCNSRQHPWKEQKGSRK